MKQAMMPQLVPPPPPFELRSVPADHEQPTALSAEIPAVLPLVLPAEDPRERYGRLRDEARGRAEAGRFGDALDVAREALEVARELDDESIVARARCNVAAMALMTGEVDPHVSDLRSILMRHHDAMTSFMAAYNLSYAYELSKQHKKALFYGRIARDRARASGERAHLANSLNQIGNSLLAESYFSDASEHYEEALALMADEMSYLSVPALINQGYCQILLGQVREGFRLLFSCLRWVRPREMRSHQTWSHLFLCAGYVEIGRIERAWRHGRKALALAEETGESDAIKAALFMMGEVERNGGDLEAAYQCFAEVQRRFFPEYAQIPELMSVVGMAEVVNLRA